MIDEKKLDRMRNGKGFVAALDQSATSTPNVLRAYGIPDDTYQTSEEMFNLAHDMRMRMMISPDFSSKYILATILFEGTLNRTVFGVSTSEYLWNEKGILSFLKIDNGLAPEMNGVQLMKDIPDLDKLLEEANAYHLFGTKARSFIKQANETGIIDVVAQQFDLAKKVYAAGLIPIIEPEIDIHSPEKGQAEVILKKEIEKHLSELAPDVKVILKLSIPNVPDFYQDFTTHHNVVRVVALSGGYKKSEANRKLAENHGMIASFSRALEEGLAYQETDMEFDYDLKESINTIYQASLV
ncbi:MAG: fructose bisphosphate aldolase [Vagococcus sp.]